jgi:hypothetical protein
MLDGVIGLIILLVNGRRLYFCRVRQSMRHSSWRATIRVSKEMSSVPRDDVFLSEPSVTRADRGAG